MNKIDKWIKSCVKKKSLKDDCANNIIKKVNRFQYYIELFKRDKSK